MRYREGEREVSGWIYTCPKPYIRIRVDSAESETMMTMMMRCLGYFTIKELKTIRNVSLERSRVKWRHFL